MVFEKWHRTELAAIRLQNGFYEQVNVYMIRELIIINHRTSIDRADFIGIVQVRIKTNPLNRVSFFGIGPNRSSKLCVGSLSKYSAIKFCSTETKRKNKTKNLKQLVEMYRTR